MKRLISILTAALLLTCCASTVMAENYTAITFQDGIGYSFYNREYVAVTDGRSTTGDVVIPETVDGIPVTKIDRTAFSNSGMTSIVLPDSIRNIEIGAFQKCTSLTRVQCGSGLKTIGLRAFGGCTALTSISLPDGLQMIDDSAFLQCTSLQQISLPADLQSIGYDVFSDCSSLQQVSLPEELNIIGIGMFSNCTSLQQITLPARLDTLPDAAFRRCTALRQITLPRQLRTIGVSAFYGCNALTSISFPEELQEIGDFAFTDCSGLQEISLPEGFQTIGHNAFYGCTSLINVSLPDSLQKIESNAFDGTPWKDGGQGMICTNSGTRLVFYRGNDKTVAVPNGVHTITDAAFFKIATIEKVILPDSVNAIEGWAFFGCAALRDINIPAHTFVSGNAFRQTPWLEDNPDIYVIAGDGCLLRYNGSGTEAIVPEGIKTICNSAFSDGDHWELQKLVLPDSLEALETSRTFSSCRNLAEVALPDHTIKNLDSAFINTPFQEIFGNGHILDGGAIYSQDRKELIQVLTGVQKLSVPEGVVWLHFINRQNIFNKLMANPYCFIFSTAKDLEEIELPASLIDPEAYAVFFSASNLKKITVSNNNPCYASIDGILFNKDCTALLAYPKMRPGKSYTIPNGTQEIAPYAFKDTTVLKHLTLPDGIVINNRAVLSENLTLHFTGNATLPKQASEFSIFELRAPAGSNVQDYAAKHFLPFTPIGYDGGPVNVSVRLRLARRPDEEYQRMVVHMAQFRLDGTDYVMLRDLAAELEKAGYGFEVDWRAEDGAILIQRNQLASIPSLHSTEPDFQLYDMATPSAASMFLDGSSISVRAYEVAGRTYVDAAAFLPLLGLEWVPSWEGDYNAILVSEPDAPPADPS